MAFFGEDGLQRQLKQAQRDLMTKDGQIASMHAVTREKDETIKKLRLEVERVREENDEMSRARLPESSGSDLDAAERKRLLAEVKEVQGALDRSKMECMQLKEEARLLHNTRMGTSPSPTIASAKPQASSSTGRRRSTSLSTDNRVKDLEAELTALREAAGSPAAEIDGLKTQLANVKRDLNKSINEKMALEARAKKDVDAVRSQLDDANFELDAMRRDFEDGGSVSKKEVERQKKAWDGEKRELQVKLGKLESQVQDRQTELESLKSVSEEVVRLTEELDRERSFKASAQAASVPVPFDTAELERLNSEIDSLRVELAQARAAQHTASASTTSTTSSDLTVRRLQRQLEKAQRDIEALEESLDQSEEENQALRSRVPLPGSPSLRAEDGRAVQLEIDNSDLRSKIQSLQSTIETLRVEIETLENAASGLRGLQPQVESLQAELKEKDVMLTETREKSTSLLDQLAASEASLARAEAESAAMSSKAASASTKLAEVESELQIAVSRVSDLELSLARANEGITAHEAREAELKQSLADSQALVAELELRPSTAFLEADLSEARSISQLLQTEKVALEEALAAANKAKDDMVDVSSRLTLEINTLNDKASRLAEELDEERDASDALRSELARTTNDSASTRTELDNVNEQLETALTDRAALETKIAELQEAISNRSTESEADARDTELSRLRFELDHLRSSLSEKEQNLEREVRLLTFTKEQEEKESTARISALQSEVANSRSALTETEASLRHQIESLHADAKTSEERIENLVREASALKVEIESARSRKSTTTAPSTPDRVGLLYAKIQSLRAERDDLRQSLSFAQNESRFTISAAQADRRSALEELQKVKSDIRSQTALHQDLEREITAVRAQLDDKEAKLQETKALFAGVTVDRGDVDDKISQYENEAATAKAKQQDLVRQLQESQQTIIELNHAMVLMRSNTETDKRHRKISMDRKSEMSMITETSSGIANEAGTSATVSFGATRRPGHTRTRSEMAALILPDQAQISALSGKVAELERELKGLSARLERRHVTIGQLQRENEKLKMAQELNKESAEDFEELVVERDELQAALSTRTAEIDGLRAEMESGKNQIETQIAKLAELEGAILSSREENDRNETRAAKLDEELAGVKGELQNAQHEVASYAARTKEADDLARHSALAASTSDTQVQSLVLDILVQRKRLATASGAWRCASRLFQSKTAALDHASAQIGDFEAERSIMSQQLEAHTSRSKALDTANEKVRDLEGQLDTLQAECDQMAQQLDEKARSETELMSRIDDLSAVREEDVKTTQAMGELETSLSSAKETVRRLESEIEGVKAELSASVAGKGEIESSLRQQTEQLSQRLSDSERLVVDKTGELEALSARLAEAETEAARVSADNETNLANARAELVDAQNALAGAQQTVGDLEKSCDELRSSLTESENRLEGLTASSTQRAATLETTNADLRQQLADNASNEVELRAKVSDMTKQHERITAEVAELTTKLDATASDAQSRQHLREKLEQEVRRLESQIQHDATAIAERDQVVQQGQQKLEQLEKELGSAREQITEASATMAQRVSELSELRSENARLQAVLAEPQDKPDAGEAAAVGELRERIEELEASLMTKTQEVDEADDRTREAYKAKAKLEKKIAKLTRQLGEKESETTKNRSKVLAVDSATIEVKPTPVVEATTVVNTVTSTHQRTPSGLTASRAPLRPVSHHDSTTQVPAATPTSLKRHRDVEGEEKPLPAEAIMLPPSNPLQSILKKTPSRTSFTPKRNISAGAENARSVYGNTAVNTAENRNNIFAPRP